MIYRPYLVLIIEVIVLCIFWYFIAGKNRIVQAADGNVSDNQLLMSNGNAVTASRLYVDNTRSGPDTIWTSDKIKAECCSGGGGGGNANIDDASTSTTTTWSSSKIASEIVNKIKAAAQPKVYFDVSRNNSFKQSGVITYAVKLLESTNSGIDIGTGIFLVPISGIYRVTFTGLRYYFIEAPTPTRVRMKKNGTDFAVTASTSEVKAIDLSPKPPGGETLSINCLIELVKGDKLWCEVEVGGLYDTSAEHVTHFTAELLIEK